MKCTSCGDTVETIGQVRACTRSRKAGIVAQIPDTLKDEDPIEKAIEASAGLARRFTDAKPPVEVEAPPGARTVTFHHDDGPLKPRAQRPRPQVKAKATKAKRRR